MSRISHGKLLLSFFKNWSIVDLQCCVSFWCTTKWFSFIFRIVCVCVCVCAHVYAKSCPTLWNSLDCSLLGSSVCGIFQARILDSVAIFSSRGSSQPRDQTCVSCISHIGRRILYHWCHLGSLYSRRSNNMIVRSKKASPKQWQDFVCTGAGVVGIPWSQIWSWDPGGLYTQPDV